MRIVFFTLKLNLEGGGGANRGMDIKLRGLQELGHDVRLVTLFPEQNRLPAEGVPYPIEEAPCANRAFLAMQKHALAVLRSYEDRADVFHIDGVSFLWAGGMYRMAGGKIPTVAYFATYAEAVDKLTPEAPDPGINFAGWFRFHALIRLQRLKHWAWGTFVGLRYAHHLDRFFVDSPVLGKAYVDFGFPSEKIDVMPEFVDAERFLASGAQGAPFPAAFDANRSMRLFHAGRLLRMKGIDLLIRAVAELRGSGRNVSCTLMGDGPQKGRLERLIRKLNVGDAIHFTDWTDETGLSHAYAACDVFVHPCRFPEPFGRTVLEALFFGRPVITSNGSGSAWVVGDAGIATRMGSSRDLTHAIRELYDHPERLKTLSAATAERMNYFDVRVWTKRLAERLASLSAQSSST